MLSSTLALVFAVSAAASLVVSADTVNLIFPAVLVGPGDAIVAQYLGHDSTATTYLLGCDKGLDANSGTLQEDSVSMYCGMGMPLTMTQGPSTVQFRREAPFKTATLTQDFQCSLSGTTSADCTITIDGAANEIAHYTSYMGEEYAPWTSEQHVHTGTDAASMWARVALVTDPASIMNLAVETGTASKKTTPAGGVFTGEFVIVPAPQETGATGASLDAKSMVTSMATPSGTKTTDSSAPASSAPSFEGAAGKMMGFGAWAAAMVVGIMAVEAL